MITRDLIKISDNRGKSYCFAFMFLDYMKFVFNLIFVIVAFYNVVIAIRFSIFSVKKCVVLMLKLAYPVWFFVFLRSSMYFPRKFSFLFLCVMFVI